MWTSAVEILILKVKVGRNLVNLFLLKLQICLSFTGQTLGVVYTGRHSNLLIELRRTAKIALFIWIIYFVFGYVWYLQQSNMLEIWYVCYGDAFHCQWLITFNHWSSLQKMDQHLGMITMRLTSSISNSRKSLTKHLRRTFWLYKWTGMLKLEGMHR